MVKFSKIINNYTIKVKIGTIIANNKKENFLSINFIYLII